MISLRLTLIMFLFFFTALNSQESYIKGTFMGQYVDTAVDHELAAYYFRKHADSPYTDTRMEILLSQTLSKVQKDTIVPKDLRYLSNTISVDFATLFFIKNVCSLENNKRAQDLFRNYLAQPEESSSNSMNTMLKEYAYVFVPGLFYKTHGDKGGDFAAQRNLLDRMGLSNYLIETNEMGSVLENAKTISDYLRALGRVHRKIIIVSVSKGGPDLAYALGKLMSHEESKNIKAWISIGGVLRGSKIADEYLKGFKRLYARTLSFFMGSDIGYIEDLSQEKSISRYDSLSFPKDLLVISYVGAPLSSQVNGDVKKNFKELSELGPNDGLTTLADELVSKGIVITELGLDHYYKDARIDKKSIALLHTALSIIEQRKTIKFTY